METYYFRNKEKRKLYAKAYHIKNKEKLNARSREYAKNNKEKIKQRYEQNKEKRQKDKYGQAYEFVKKFNICMEGQKHYPQYILNPEKINENRVFSKEDFEYIKSMSNFNYPSLENNRQKNIQEYNIYMKYLTDKKKQDYVLYMNKYMDKYRKDILLTKISNKRWNVVEYVE